MEFKVKNVFRVGNNTSVTIEGNGDGLKNGMRANNGKFRILSVAMVNTTDGLPETTLLVEGDFQEKTINV